MRFAFGLCFSLALLAGCGTPATALRARAGDGLNCEPFQVQTERDHDRGVEHVSGCNRRLVYDWVCQPDGDCEWAPISG